MPASKTVEAFKDKGLLIDIEPVNQEPTVYFTDESPRFKMMIRNTSESDFVKGSSIRWVIAIGSGMPSPVYSEVIEIEVLVGEEREYVIGGELLAFEGHGVIGVSIRSASSAGDPDYKLHDGPAQKYDPVYTFSVWAGDCVIQSDNLYHNPRPDKITITIGPNVCNHKVNESSVTPDKTYADTTSDNTSVTMTNKATTDFLSRFLNLS